MDKTETEILRGARAEQLMQEPLIIEALQTIERELTDQWQNSPVRDLEGREKLFLTLLCLGKFKGHLHSVMETGVMAKLTLAQRTGQTLKRVFSQ